jgi:RNA polymerase-binding protein DksA
MPRLSTHQIDELRRQNLARRSALLEAARAELGYGEHSPYAEIMSEVGDEVDRATAATVADFDNEIARRHGAELRQIDAALARIDGHCYGTCEDCGADIGYARLAAFPAANRCIDCQRLRERMHAHEATPSL